MGPECVEFYEISIISIDEANIPVSRRTAIESRRQEWTRVDVIELSTFSRDHREGKISVLDSI